MAANVSGRPHLSEGLSQLSKTTVFFLWAASLSTPSPKHWAASMAIPSEKPYLRFQALWQAHCLPFASGMAWWPPGLMAGLYKGKAPTPGTSGWPRGPKRRYCRMPQWHPLIPRACIVQHRGRGHWTEPRRCTLCGHSDLYKGANLPEGLLW